MTLTPGRSPFHHNKMPHDAKQHTYENHLFCYQRDVLLGVNDSAKLKEAISFLNKMKEDTARPAHITDSSIDQAIHYIQNQVLPLESFAERTKALNNLHFPPDDLSQPWQKDLQNYLAARANIDFNIKDPKGYNDAVDALQKLKKDGYPGASEQEIDNAISILLQARDVPIDLEIPMPAITYKEKILSQLNFPPRNYL